MTEDFEDGVGLWDFSNGAEFPGAAGHLEAVPEAARSGKTGARLFYDFHRGGAYVGMSFILPEPEKLSAVEFEVRQPASVRLTFRATDRMGQTCQKPIEFDSTDWQTIRVRMDRWAFSWGGPADRRLRQPVTRIAILVERQGLSANRRVGHVDVDRVRFIPAAKSASRPEAPLEYIALEFPGGRKVSLPERAGEIQWTGGAGTLFGEPVEIAVTVAGAAAEAELVLRCGSHFEHFERSLGTVRPGAGEQTLSVPAPPGGWRWYGGENDGRLHGPVRLDGIGVRRARKGVAAGAVVVRRVTVRTRMPREQAVVIVPRHRSGQGGESALEVTLHNLLATPLSGRFTAEFRDETGQPTGRVERTLELPPKGEAVRLPVAPPVEDAVCSDITLSFASTDGRVRAVPVSAGLAAGIATGGNAKLVPESPWGMGLYLYRYPDTSDGSARMNRAAALARAAGVKWTREEILWHRTEPEKGRFDFRFYDRVVDCAHRHGVSVYGLLDYWSSWTKPYTEEGIADYCRWAAHVVAHYKDRIHYWEIWNEPNIFFWNGPKELYPVLLKRACAAIKKVDPGANILGCSTSGIDTPFIRRVMDADAPFDILTIHPYRGSLDDGGFMEELRGVRKLVGGRPVWITEMGWPTQIGGVSELEQARLLSRCYLCAAAVGGSPTVSWYDFREDGTDPFYNENHFGAVRYDLAPKAAYRALATVCNTLGTVTAARRLSVPDGFLGRCFEASDRAPTAVLWSRHRGGVFLVRGLSEHAVLRSFIGRDKPVEVRDGIAFVSVAPGAPIFLPDSKRAEFAGPVLAWTRHPLSLSPGRSNALSLTVDNVSPWPLTGPIELDAPAGWRVAVPAFSCNPGVRRTVAVRVTPPSNVRPDAYPFVLSVRTPHGKLVLVDTVRVLPAVIER